LQHKVSLKAIIIILLLASLAFTIAHTSSQAGRNLTIEGKQIKSFLQAIISLGRLLSRNRDDAASHGEEEEKWKEKYHATLNLQNG
jgi:hypothetical protein